MMIRKPVIVTPAVKAEGHLGILYRTLRGADVCTALWPSPHTIKRQQFINENGTSSH